MRHTEHAVVFDCSGERLVGVLSEPESPGETGVIVIVGGPQYRAGSHRQFVLLARHLADGGHPVLRFDYRGMGDASGPQRTFEAVDEDIAAAIDAMQRRLPRIARIVLWGLCDGASAALMYWHRSRDARVSGLCLLNPWIRTESSQARTQVKHYYTRRLREREFWLKLLSGGVGTSALGGLARSLGRAWRGSSATDASESGGDAALPYPQRMAAAWQRFDGRILLILSGNDYTAKEFLEFIAIDPAWRGALSRSNLEREDIAEADHTFADSASRQRVEARTLSWLRQGEPPATPVPVATGHLLPEAQ